MRKIEGEEGAELSVVVWYTGFFRAHPTCVDKKAEEERATDRIDITGRHEKLKVTRRCTTAGTSEPSDRRLVPRDAWDVRGAERIFLWRAIGVGRVL